MLISISARGLRKSRKERPDRRPHSIRPRRQNPLASRTATTEDTHLYEFRAGGAAWGEPDPDGFYDGPLPAKKTTLQKVIEDTGARTIQYAYDFGDDWDHAIRVEKVSEANAGVSYPRLLMASGACPPEDVGGVYGYEEFLQALAVPRHEQHEEMVDWSEGAFDPEDARPERIVERFAQLAKKWAPKPAKPKAVSLD